MLTNDQTRGTASPLTERFGDAVTAPGDAGWDPARGAFNLLVDQRPEAIARPRSASEAAAIVSAAGELGLRIAPQGSAHNAGPLGSLEGTLLIRGERMTGVEIDAARRSARVEAGARWWDVTPRASELGLAALHGSSPEINVVGYSLGGGVGWMARKHGLQTNHLTAIEIVTADGAARRVDADNEPELFWALRGGSGNFGFVTAVEFELIEVRELYAGTLFFPYERAAEVLHAWHEWVATAPEELTSVGGTLQLPDLELIPEIVRGRSFARVEAVYAGGEADGAELLEPLRRLGPEMDTLAMVPPVGLANLHLDPIEPIPYLSAHAMLGDLAPADVEDYLSVVGPGSGSPLSLELRHMGGALERGAPGHGALDTLSGTYMMFALAGVLDPADAPGLEAELARVAASFEPHDVGRYSNFTEQPHDVEAMYPTGTLERLRRVKADHDPEGIFKANHPV
ncbi:MAG: FAD-binding protein [Solirubrobacterales bacterium]|nr:FAD-binding protein [Solirubrobacterales bacterium]